MKGWFFWLHDKWPTCEHVAAKGRQEGTTRPLLTILFFHMQHFIPWTKHWIPRVFSQLGWCCSGDECGSTACLSLKQKQERSQHASRKQTRLDTIRRADLRKVLTKFDWGDSPDVSDGGLGPHNSGGAARQAQGSCAAWPRHRSGGVKGQTTENKTSSKSQFCLGGGNWTLNMPAVKQPIDN